MQGLTAVGSVAEDFPQCDPPVLHQGAIRRLGFRDIQSHSPDRRGQAVTQALQAADQSTAPGFVALAQDAQEGGEQRGGQDGDAFLGDDAAGHHREIGVVGVEQRAVDVVVLAGDNEQVRVKFVAVTAMDRLFTSLSLPAMIPAALSIPAWSRVRLRCHRPG
jgi:hypothetical protein